MSNHHSVLSVFDKDASISSGLLTKTKTIDDADYGLGLDFVSEEDQKYDQIASENNAIFTSGDLENDRGRWANKEQKLALRTNKIMSDYRFLRKK